MKKKLGLMKNVLSLFEVCNIIPLPFYLRAQKLEKYERCGTVQDLVVKLLCGNDRVIMSTQNAASWGYFMPEEARWELESLTNAGFPVHLLPDVILKPGQVAGKLVKTWFGIPAGVTVGTELIILT